MTTITNSTTKYLLLDGTNGYADVADSADFSIGTTLALTMSFWIRPDVLTYPVEEGSGGDRYVGLFSKLGLNQNEWSFRIYGADDANGNAGKISFYIFALTGGIGDGVAFIDAVQLNKWIHLTGTIQDVGGGVTGIRIYKNGVRRDSFSSSITYGNGTSGPLIGANSSNSSSVTSYFQGAIDDVRVYNKRLSDVEVAGLYSEGRGGNDSITGLTHRWRFDAGTGTTAVDDVGGLSASLHGGAVLFDTKNFPSNTTRYFPPSGSAFK